MPERHVRPESVDVAQPMPAAPPSRKRPDLEGRDRRRSPRRRRSARPPSGAGLRRSSACRRDPPRDELAVPRDRVGEIRGDGVDTPAARHAVGPAEHGVDPVGLRRAPLIRSHRRRRPRPPARAARGRSAPGPWTRARAQSTGGDTILSLLATGLETIQSGDLRGRRHLGDRRRRWAGRGANGRGRRRRRRSSCAARSPASARRRSCRSSGAAAVRPKTRGAPGPTRCSSSPRTRRRRRRRSRRDRRARAPSWVSTSSSACRTRTCSSACSSSTIPRRSISQPTISSARSSCSPTCPSGSSRSQRRATSRESEVVELERRGVDAVIVPARNVAELVGGAPPAV